nr:tetratricopeptide repeat protein [Candidatus Cyanaurora vandensis]
MYRGALQEQALTLYRKITGEENLNLAQSLSNLAVFYKSQGRYDQAELLLQQALALRIKLLGQEHPDVAASMNNLAELYTSQGRYDQAEPLLQQALVLYLKLLGEEHSDGVKTLGSLGLLYLKQYEWRRAYLIFEQSIAMAQNFQIQSSVLPILRGQFKNCFRELVKSGVDARELEDWLNLWRTVAEGRAEFQVTFRLLETLWKYRKTNGDVRVLLELPVEERGILQAAMAAYGP